MRYRFFNILLVNHTFLRLAHPVHRFLASLCREATNSNILVAFFVSSVAQGYSSYCVRIDSFGMKEILQVSMELQYFSAVDMFPESDIDLVWLSKPLAVICNFL